MKQKKKKIIPPTLILAIFAKPGAQWTKEELVAVFDWLNSELVFDEFVQFAFGFTRDLKLAMDVVNDKITYIFRYCKTYDPKKYPGKNNAFLNYLYTIIARAVVRKIEADRRRDERLKELLRRQAERDRLARDRRDAERVKQIELQQIKERYLPRLKTIYQQAMQLVVFEELTYAEAAEIASAELSCMKLRVMRARQQVREMRDKDEGRTWKGEIKL